MKLTAVVLSFVLCELLYFFFLFDTVYFLAAYFRVQSNFEIISVWLLLFISEKIEVGSQIIYADFQENFMLQI